MKNKLYSRQTQNRDTKNILITFIVSSENERKREMIMLSIQICNTPKGNRQRFHNLCKEWNTKTLYKKEIKMLGNTATQTDYSRNVTNYQQIYCVFTPSNKI